MVVAANPGSSMDLAPEIELVKAALLYGDSVTLLSPVTTMLMRAEGLRNFSLLDLIQLVRRCAPVLSGYEPDSEGGFGSLDAALAVADRHELESLLVRSGMMPQLKEAQRELAAVVTLMRNESGLSGLDSARARGLVVLENADPGDDMDLLVSCIESAKAVQDGQRPANPHSDRIVETFVRLLSRHLSEGREYLVFDPPIASLTEAAVEEGIFAPRRGPAGRSAQAMAAAGLMGFLPTFPDASVDEVLDIRDALVDPLSAFRGAMVGVARDIASRPWEPGFGDEVQDAWVGVVQPALMAIQSAVRDDRSLVERASGIAGQINQNWPALGLVGAGLVGHKPVLDAIGGATAVGSSLLQQLSSHRMKQTAIEMKPFYFLHGVSTSLT